MKIFRLLCVYALLCCSSVVCADEVYQKVYSPSELNETDAYIICDEGSTHAIRKTNGSFLGAMNIRQDDLKGDYLIIDPDKSSVPDEFRLVNVKENIYCIPYVGSSEFIYYDGSSNYLRSKVMSTSDWNAQWSFNATSNGVSVDCANRKNYFISPYYSKFGVYTQKNDHIKTCLYKKVATKAKQVVVGGAGYVSFVAPAKINLRVTSGLMAYTVTQASTEEVILSSINVIPKNTPVVLHGAPGIYYLSYANQGVSAVEGNLLKVSDGSVTGNRQTIYSLANIDGVVAFYLVGQDVVIPAGKVYLQIAQEQASLSRCLTMSLVEHRGITTDIVRVCHQEDVEWYTIDGRKLSGRPSTKGLYIRNGKKHIINE